MSELPWSARWDCDKRDRGGGGVDVGMRRNFLISTMELRLGGQIHHVGAEQDRRNFPGQHGGIATFLSSLQA